MVLGLRVILCSRVYYFESVAEVESDSRNEGGADSLVLGVNLAGKNKRDRTLKGIG